MSASPKRPWFRFHLLTAVLMMVAAGVDLRLNTVHAEWRPWLTYTCVELPAEQGLSRRYMGWPFVARCMDERQGGIRYDGWFSDGNIADAIVAVILLAAVARVSEYIIRRRSDRRPPAAS